MPINVRLEPLATRHDRAFLAAVQRSRALHRPWVSPPDSPRDFAAQFSRCADDRRETYLIVDLVSGSLVGVVNNNEIVRRSFQSAYLGYYVFAPFQAKGYMAAGLSKTITHAFRNLKLHRLEANIQPANKRSINLVKRLGFHCEGLSPRYLKINGRWRDHERWAILKEQWRGNSRR